MVRNFRKLGISRNYKGTELWLDKQHFYGKFRTDDISNASSFVSLPLAWYRDAGFKVFSNHFFGNNWGTILRTNY